MPRVKVSACLFYDGKRGSKNTKKWRASKEDKNLLKVPHCCKPQEGLVLHGLKTFIRLEKYSVYLSFRNKKLSWCDNSSPPCNCVETFCPFHGKRYLVVMHLQFQ